jgi:hypothetical protein
MDVVESLNFAQRSTLPRNAIPNAAKPVMHRFSKACLALSLLAVLAQAGCCAHVIADRTWQGPLAGRKGCCHSAGWGDAPVATNRRDVSDGETPFFLASASDTDWPLSLLGRRWSLAGDGLLADTCLACGLRGHRGKCRPPWLFRAQDDLDPKHEGPLPNPTFRPPYPRFFPVPTEDVFAPRSDYHNAPPLWEDRRMAPPYFPPDGHSPQPSRTPNYGIPTGGSGGASSGDR